MGPKPGVLPENQQPLNTRRGGMSQNVLNPGFADEAEPVAPDTLTPQIGGGERDTQGGEAVGQSPVAGKFRDPVAKPQNTGMTLVGQVYTPEPPSDAQKRAQHERAIRDAEDRKAIAEGEAMGLAESVLSDYANVAAVDALEARELHKTHFAKAKQRIAQLDSNVQEAMAMKVNPYNWHESVGRGGRVAAAFSLLTGQMAAGAGNPNSALKMMDAAIERDIAAQEQNIKTKFDAIKQMSGLAKDERALYGEELASLNETRAVLYAAMTGRIAAAKQHAMNEAHYAALEVAEDHYQLKLLDARQAARQNIHVEVEMATSAAKIRVQQRQIAQVQKSLEVGTPLPAPGGQAPSGAATTSAEETSATTLKRPPGRAGSVGARRGRRGSGATPPTSRVESVEDTQGAADPGARESVPATPQPIEADGQSRMETQEEAEARVASEVAAKADAQGLAQIRTAPARDLQGLGRKAMVGGRVTEKEVADVITKPRSEGGANVPQRVAKAGGYGLAFITDPEEGTGEPSHKTTSLAEGLQDIAAGKRIRNGGFIMNADADLVSAMVPPPNPTLYVGGAAGAGYKIAKQAYDYGQEFEEIYETRATVGGQRNTIVAGGMSYKLSEGAIERTDEKAYGEMQKKLAEVATGTKALRALATQIRTHGIQGIFTPEGGFNIPGFNTDDETTLLLANRTITNAMQYIKTHDPTARISDKDLEVGQNAMGAFMTKGSKFMDFLQSLDGDSMNNTKRKQIENFLVHIAVESQRMVWEKFENSLVPDYNTMISMAQEADEVQKFIDQDRRR